MNNVFGFLDMMDNYEKRKVAVHKDGDLFVSTVAVTDSTQPYETAVAHSAYNEGKIIIVEQYDTIEDARAGHDRWIETMKNPSRQLTDVSTSILGVLYRAIGELPPAERAADVDKPSG